MSDTRARRLGAWAYWQLPYAARCYAYRPVTYVRRVRFGGDPVWRQYYWDRWALGRTAQGRRSLPEGAIWLNVNSGGELMQAIGLCGRWAARHPDRPLIIFTESPDTFAHARRLIPQAREVVYMPWDLEWIVQRLLRQARPSGVIFMEHLFFPVLAREAQAAGVRTALVSGLMGRNVGHRNWWILRSAALRGIEGLDAIGAKTAEDADGFRRLGARPEAVSVTGDLRYDVGHWRLKPEERARWRDALGLPPQARVVVAGSVHASDAGALIDALRTARRRFPDLRLIVVPRWMDDLATLESACARGGWSTQRRSSLGRLGTSQGTPPAGAADVIFLDTFGELARAYGVGDAAFIGASLVPINERRGGHNVLEPLAHGIPIFFGPHMNFWRAVTDRCEAAWSGFLVRSGEELGARLVEFWERPELQPALEAAARDILAEHTGALERTLEQMDGVLGWSNRTEAERCAGSLVASR